MHYKVMFKPAADRDLEKINPGDRSRILQKIEGLKEDPRPPGSLKLHGPQNIYRLRSGKYRILYQVRDRELIVIIVRAGHRREVYRDR